MSAIDNLEVLRKQHQRDINCLSEPDRNVKRRALKKINDTFFGKRNKTTASKIDQVIFFRELLQQKLVALFGDDIEGVRELSINIVTRFMEEVLTTQGDEQTENCLKELSALVIKACGDRIGVLPFNESSEELRLLLLILLKLILQSKACISNIELHLSTLCKTFSKSLTDNFHECKKQCSECVITLVALCPTQIHLHFEILLKALVNNLKHQHSKVRQITVTAIGQLTLHSGESLEKQMTETILPQLKKLGSDRSATVRKEAVIVTSNWILHLPEKEKYQASLIPALLVALADETPEVQQFALEKLEIVGEACSQNSMDTSNSHDNDVESKLKQKTISLPEPFTSRPNRGVRILITNLLGDILPNLITDTEDWTVAGRSRAVKLLRGLLVYTEDGCTAYLESILSTLCRTCMDEEASIRHVSLECSQLAGFYVPCDAVMSVLLPRVMGTVSGLDTVQHRSGALCILSAVICGLSKESLESFVNDIVATLSDVSLLEHEAVEIQFHLFKSARDLIDSLLDKQFSGLSVKNTHKLLKVLIQLSISSSDEAIREASAGSIFQLIQLSGFNSADSFYAVHCGLMLCSVILGESRAIDDNALVDKPAEYLTEVVPLAVEQSKAATMEWKRYSYSRQLFDQTIRLSTVKVVDTSKLFGLVVAVLLNTATAEKDPDLRLAMLALLESILSAEADCVTLVRYLPKLVNDVLLPNIVWRVGRVATTIRKVSCFCLYSLFKSSKGGHSTIWLNTIVGQLLPILKTALDDQEADTRKFVCLCFQQVFRLLKSFNNPEKEMYELGHSVYHDMIKRLDDANDDVRIASCGMLTAFISAIPSISAKGTASDYIVETLFVHLDDTNVDIQKSVYFVLKTIAGFNAESVIKKAKQERARHRSPFFCDELVNVASN